MPTLEERVQSLEKEVAERKRSEEMLTIAVRALVSKEVFERLQETVKEFQEQSGKLFNVVINQNSLHNERMADVQGQLMNQDNKIAELGDNFTELDGKVVGLQTEMRQRFTEHTARFDRVDTALTQILARLPEKP